MGTLTSVYLLLMLFRAFTDLRLSVDFFKGLNLKDARGFKISEMEQLLTHRWIMKYCHFGYLAAKSVKICVHFLIKCEEERKSQQSKVGGFL